MAKKSQKSAAVFQSSSKKQIKRHKKNMTKSEKNSFKEYRGQGK